MAITYTWEINGIACKKDVADKYFTKVVYRVKGMDDSTEKARYTGEVNFTKPSSLPSDFIAFDESAGKPDQATMITWVKNSLGTDAVTLIETDLKSQIDLVNTPVETAGVAF